MTPRRHREQGLLCLQDVTRHSWLSERRRFPRGAAPPVEPQHSQRSAALQPLSSTPHTWGSQRQQGAGERPAHQPPTPTRDTPRRDLNPRTPPPQALQLPGTRHKEQRDHITHRGSQPPAPVSGNTTPGLGRLTDGLPDHLVWGLKRPPVLPRAMAKPPCPRLGREVS